MRSLLRFPILILILAAASALSCATGTEGPVCGNGIIERGEECDRDDIAGRTCTDLGFGRGVVTCGSFCTFSTVACFPACASECDTEDQVRCQGNQLELCARSEDGCLRWALSRDCAADSLVCNDFLTPPACSDSCQDACTQSQSRCYGFTVQSCETGVTGCTQWTDQTQCSDTSQVCFDAGGTAVCTAECQDPCASEGLRRCTAETAQVCVADAVGCRVFLDIQDCAATSQFCVDGFCADCPAAPCTSGARRCNGTTVERCLTDANGCLNWVGYLICIEDCFNGICIRENDPRE